MPISKRKPARKRLNRAATAAALRAAADKIEATGVVSAKYTIPQVNKAQEKVLDLIDGIGVDPSRVKVAVVGEDGADPILSVTSRRDILAKIKEVLSKAFPIVSSDHGEVSVRVRQVLAASVRAEMVDDYEDEDEFDDADEFDLDEDDEASLLLDYEPS